MMICYDVKCDDPAVAKGLCKSHYDVMRANLKKKLENYPETTPELMSEEYLRKIGRFLSKIDFSSSECCWEWAGAKNEKGYGSFRLEGERTRAAHRVMWIFSYGEIPEGLHVLHKCDNPGCVKPSHLFLGTNADNVADKEAKGRGVRIYGEKNRNSKLTMEKAESIRSEIKTKGVSQRELAAKYGVRQQTICNIVNNKTWVKNG